MRVPYFCTGCGKEFVGDYHAPLDEDTGTGGLWGVLPLGAAECGGALRVTWEDTADE